MNILSSIKAKIAYERESYAMSQDHIRKALAERKDKTKKTK